MSFQNIEQQASSLGLGFAQYAQSHQLPSGLFERPDHVALRAADIRDFDQKVKQIDRVSEQIVLRESLDRFIVAAQLMGSLSVANQGRVRWLEIIEPLWEEAELGPAGRGHVEFFYPDFEVATSVLNNKDVKYRIDDYPQPRIKVPYNERGDEFRFTRVSLETIVAHDVVAGEAKLLKAAA